MIVTILKVAASAATVTLAGSCGRNMLQAFELRNSDNLPDLSIQKLPSTDHAMKTVEDLHSLNRLELLSLFSSGEIPIDLSDIEGEWEGELLDNNGAIMTTVSNIMTNGFFALGPGRTWNGKRFENNGVTGVNRFFTQKENRGDTKIRFDVSIEESKLNPGKPCIQLKYFNHQSPISPWKTMVDELRMVPGTKEVLLGMGSMAWSGGSANSAPFCLRRLPKPSKDSAMEEL
ncbi:unnamed protein product [Cylindrotheca closterium]|uniref:NADH:ubiquinone oxidoreductase intermediate-associated protein 30 domain-containing protein n=1 Tax=Cylindrotheca closterium TaxID=2856 RepID=A0AAD2GAE6_9STRA|nr:unnamed protein product [Cylindrotheca closterium]